MQAKGEERHLEVQSVEEKSLSKFKVAAKAHTAEGAVTIKETSLMHGDARPHPPNVETVRCSLI